MAVGRLRTAIEVKRGLVSLIEVFWLTPEYAPRGFTSLPTPSIRYLIAWDTNRWGLLPLLGLVLLGAARFAVASWWLIEGRVKLSWFAPSES